MFNGNIKFKMIIEEIKLKAKDLANIIRSYSESQKDIWQQIPYWANQADGRSGWSDNLYRAVHYGYLGIDSPIIPRGGFYVGFVDLENGKIMAGTDSNHEDSYDFINFF